MIGFEKITYTNENGESIQFSTNSIYHVNIKKDVSGLHGFENEIYADDRIGVAGEIYTGNHLQRREIEIVGLIRSRDKYVALNLVHIMLKSMNPNISAVLTYEFGKEVRKIDCRVKNIDINKKGPILYQFTILLICPEFYWRDSVQQRADIASWIGAFEFLDPDGLELHDEWEIEYREPSLIVNAYNSGDDPCGIIAEFKSIGNVTNPAITNIETNETIKLNMQMQSGDFVRVDTRYGRKSVTKIANSDEEIDIFRMLDINSRFISLKTGDNLFRYSADSGAEYLEVAILHENLYLGV